MFHLRFAARFERLFHWALGAALLLGLLAGVLLPRIAVQAQAANAQTYSVLAGGSAISNTTVLAFAPQSLTVHRGDTVMWVLGGFHNIHFELAPSDLIITSEVNGQPLPQLNPAVAFPSAANGSVFQGGDANSGISVDPTNPMITFSLVMDVAPGVYNYFCDLHPGMLGSVTVVDDATSVPSPAEALTSGAAELAADGGQAAAAVGAAAAEPPTVSDGTLEVKAGLQAGPSAVLQFFPSTAVIHAGESVTWSVADHSLEPHFVTWPSFPPGGEFEVIPQAGRAADPRAEPERFRLDRQRQRDQQRREFQQWVYHARPELHLEVHRTRRLQLRLRDPCGDARGSRRDARLLTTCLVVMGGAVIYSPTSGEVTQEE